MFDQHSHHRLQIIDSAPAGCTTLKARQASTTSTGWKALLQSLASMDPVLQSMLRKKYAYKRMPYGNIALQLHEDEISLKHRVGCTG